MTIWLVAGGLHAAERTAALRKLPTLPAEFENHDALLVSWNADDEGVEEAMTAIVSAVHRNLQVIVLIPDDEYLRGAMRCFSLAGIPQAAVRYVRAPVDTIWTRDYGPASIRIADGTMALIDADYETGTRSHDDHLPAAIAPLLGLSAVHVPLTIEGGNLLSNGNGLCVATTKLRDANLARGYSESQFRELLAQVYGFSEAVFLEPLDGEPTGHVDMFATFVAPNVAVVGEYDPHIDPVNAQVLDRNVERLAAVRTRGGRLHIVRVPMPPSSPDVWRTYTNVLYANGTLLVPSYPGITPEYEREAHDIFQHLLPGWQVVPVDCNQLIALGGGVHCVTMNVCRIARLPRAIDPRELPEAGGAFPGDEAAPRRLVVDRIARQPSRGAAAPLPDVEQAMLVAAPNDFDVADECSPCCPTADRFPAQSSRALDGPHPPGWQPARGDAAGRTPAFRRDRPGWPVHDAAADRLGFVVPRHGASDPHTGFTDRRGDMARPHLAPGWSD